MHTGPYSAAEDAAIIEHYSSKTLKEIAALLNRPHLGLAKRSHVLVQQGRLSYAQRFYGRPWTDEEIDYLAENWGLLTDEAVAAHLGRSVGACLHAAGQRAGVTRKMQFYTAATVAHLFGVDWHRVERWIEAGLLKAKRSHIRGVYGNVWHIGDEAITAFIRQHPWAYDRTRIEGGTWWRNLAERVWRADPLLTATEAAARLGCTKETVMRHCRRGWLVAYRTWEAGQHGGWRIPTSSLAQFRYRRPPHLSGIAAYWRERTERRRA
jgi:excisionase family DNA binding protein